MPRWLLPDCHIRLDKNFPRNLFRILGMCSFVSPPNIMCGVVAPTILYHIWGLSKMRETENIILHDCKILQFPKHNATAADVIIFRRIEVCILRVDGLQSVCLLALNVPLIPCAITLAGLLVLPQNLPICKCGGANRACQDQKEVIKLHIQSESFNYT